MPAMTFEEILKNNPYHDPRTGRFTSGPGGGVAVASASSFTPAGTIQEAREYAKTKLGFSGYVDYSYSYIDQKTIREVSGTLDIDTVNHINKTITDIQDRYPETKGYIKNLECTNANVYAAVVHSGRDATASLVIGAKAYKDGVDAVNKKWADDVELGYHPKGTTGEAVLWHEYGHTYAAVENIKTCGQAATTRSKLTAINNKVAESGWRQEAAQKLAVSSDSGSYGKNISRYATKDDAELFAEAFAAYNTGHGTKWTDALMEAAGADRRK